MTDPDQTQSRADEPSVPASEFSIAVERGHDQVRIAPHGELDLANVGQLEGQLAELLAAGFTRVTIDLRGVEFLDSSGLHALLTAHSDAQRDHWELSIIPGPPVVQRLFELTSTIDSLPFIADS